MMGHTNTKTINQRRPLTENMMRLLRSAEVRSRQIPNVLFSGELSQAEKNAARALIDRKMLWWDSALLGYCINEEGRRAIALTDKSTR